MNETEYNVDMLIPCMAHLGQINDWLHITPWNCNKNVDVEKATIASKAQVTREPWFTLVNMECKNQG